MIGAIAGDFIGSVYEFVPHRSKLFPLFHRDCAVTDDTVLTSAVAPRLLVGGRGVGESSTIVAGLKLVVACWVGWLMSNMMVSVIGPMKAADMPRTMRKEIIAVSDGAAPQAAEETRNRGVEYMNRLREPT